MKKVHDFVAGLARNRKSTAEIKKDPPELFMGTRPEGWPQFTMSL
jgi:hypothetical protein